MADVNDRGGPLHHDFNVDPCALSTALLKAMNLENQYVTSIVLTLPRDGYVRASVEMYVQVEDDPRLAAAVENCLAGSECEEKAR